MKLITALFILVTLTFAKELTPAFTIDANESVKDMVLRDNSLVLGTDEGKLKVYNLLQKKFTKIVHLPKIKDFMGDTIEARVSSVDFLNGKYLMLSDSGIGGYSDLRVLDNDKLVDIFTENDKLPLVEAKFIDSNNILLGFLSNEAALYNIKSKKFLYRIQLSQSRFSKFALNKKRTIAAFACESGEVNLIDTKSGKILKKLNLNLDNIFSVDIKKDIVATGGKDRRAVWYNIKNNKKDYIQSNFFVYATALNPDATKAAFTLDTNNNITIIDLATKSKEYLLKGQKSVINSIIFKDNNTVFAASNDDFVNIWKLK